MSELIKTTVSYHETGPELLNKRRPILQVQANNNQATSNHRQHQLASAIRANIDIGRDNPFRPGGVIYKSADPIVDYYKQSSNLNSRPQSPTESQQQLDILLGRVKEAEKQSESSGNATGSEGETRDHSSRWRKFFCFCRKSNHNSKESKKKKKKDNSRDATEKCKQIKTNECDKQFMDTSEIDHFNVKSSLRQQAPHQQQQRDGSVASSNQHSNFNTNSIENTDKNKQLIRGDSSSISVGSSSAKLSFRPVTHITELRFDDSSFSNASIIDPSNKSQSLNQEKSVNSNLRFSNRLNRNNSDDSQQQEQASTTSTQRQRNIGLHNQRQQQQSMVHRTPIININSSERRSEISDDHSEKAREMFEQAKGEIGPRKRKNCQTNAGEAQATTSNSSCTVS